ncbi:MAG: sigma-70 family RNA polymerase sigma factor, partial [Oscillospiraceae bacterium]|nr:sigma-70 family RNA polymerase sigma factor [Oscillospiraceae bacterium]
VLSAFVSRITRNLSLKRYEYLTAEKRNQNAAVSLEELGDCLSGTETPEGALETKRVIQALNRFLWNQPEQARDMFLRRYWYFDTVTEIAQRHHCSVDQVSSSLYRTRKRLKDFLEKEGIDL